MTERRVIRVPGDKSISHRALILAALANGQSRIRGILDVADIRSTAAVLRLLGVPVPDFGRELRFKGSGLRGLREPGSALDAGNSGTTVPLVAGVVAAHPFSTRFTGNARLSRKPMKRIAEPLTAMGARFDYARDDGLPMTVHGAPLSGIVWNTRAESAQTKGAILLAGLAGGVQVSVREARRSRDHTERLLASMGAPVTVDELTVTLSPVDSIAPLELTVPADPSSAAYFVALAILTDRGEVVLPEVCLNPTRIGFLEVMKSMGGEIDCSHKNAVGGDSAATVIARPSELRSIAVNAEVIPRMIDELPLLACVAAASDLDLEVSGAGDLGSTEGDRIASIVANLRAIGADADELPDGFAVSGRRRPLAGRVTTNGDPRIAMSFGVLSQIPGNSIELDDPDCVSGTYPRFWADLANPGT